MADENQLEDKNLEELQRDLDTATNNWKRTLADFENYKRRKESENKELLEFAKEVTVVKLLPAIDSLEQALRHLPKYRNSAQSENQISDSGYLDANSGNSDYDFEKIYQNWQTGINGLVVQLDKVLEDMGVRKIETVGKKFDPNFHEAVKEVDSEGEDGTVVDELQSGFELNGKVIRPSQVTISKRK